MEIKGRKSKRSDIEEATCCKQRKNRIERRKVDRKGRFKKSKVNNVFLRPRIKEWKLKEGRVRETVEKKRCGVSKGRTELRGA